MCPAFRPSHCLVCCLQSAKARQAGAQVRAGHLLQERAAAGQTPMLRTPLETRGAHPAGAGVAPAQGGESWQPCCHDSLLADCMLSNRSPHLVGQPCCCKAAGTCRL